MRRTTFLIGILMTLAISSAASGAQTPDPEFRLSHHVQPTFQEIFLTVDPGRPDYTGSVRIELSVKQALREFTFHAQEMDLTRVSLTDSQGSIGLETRPDETGLIRASAARELTPGEYVLEIDFSHQYGTRSLGLYKVDYEGESYLFTQFESDDAREAFPCWDEPMFKFPYQMTLTVPEGDMAVANTPIISESTTNGMRTVTFARTRPMPSYLLALAVGPLETVEIPGMNCPGNLITPKGKASLAGEAIRQTPPLLAALEDYFGRPYPYEKLDLIAVPEFWAGAMENPGLVTFRDTILLMDPDAKSVSTQRRMAAVIAHELAHMWFGDLVTMEWWDDLWLNESFASWLGDKVTDQVFPEFNMKVTQLDGAARAFDVDAQLATRAIRKPVSPKENLIQTADVLAYQKGQAVLGMFERWLGEETFRKGVVHYIDEHAWGNARGEDLWNALGEVSGENVPVALASFLDQPGFPIISVEPLGGNRVRVSQRRFMNYGVEARGEQIWQVPVGMKFLDEDGLRSETFLLTEPSRTVELAARGEIQWLHPNADELGYYRWEVPSGMMEKLAESAPEMMNTRERVGFVQNGTSLLDAGMSGDRYLEVLNRFSGDPEPEVVSAILAGLGKVKTAFVPVDLELPFATYVRATLTPVLERVGLEPRKHEPEPVTLFRPELLTWLGREGRDPAVLAWAAKQAETYFEDPASVHPTLTGTVLNLNALGGDARLFDTYRTRFETASMPADRGRFLAAMANFRDPAIQAKALEYSVTGPVRPNEMLTIPMAVGAVAGDSDVRWNWLTANYDRIFEKLPTIYGVYMPYLAAGCSLERLEKARAFFAEPRHAPPGTEKEFARMAEGVRTCVGLREREGEAVRKYLEALPPGK